MRVSDEPQGEPLEATTPPATAGEWRGYHGDDCPRRWKGTFNSTADECTCGLDEAHNAASRLRIAEEKAALADEKWSRPIESDGFRTFCYECGADMSTNRLNLSGPVIPEHEAGCLKARYDALKGSSHE